MRKKGFTLLEIIIVLFLAALILGLSAFFFTGYLPSARVNAAGRELAGMIRYTRSLARLNTETRTLIIDLDNRNYGVEGLTTKNFPPDVMVRIIDPLTGEIVQGKYPIVFTPAGGMKGGTIIISQGKKIIKIDLDPVTGAVLLK